MGRFLFKIGEDKMKNKTLKEKREELFKKMCEILPDFKWGLLFEEIIEQDKQFIKDLKDKTKSWRSEEHTSELQ